MRLPACHREAVTLPLGQVSTVPFFFFFCIPGTPREKKEAQVVRDPHSGKGTR